MTKTYNYNRYGDNLARKQRRRFFIISLSVIICGLSLGTGLFYLFFVSQALQINALEISGTEVLQKESIISKLHSIANENVWPILAVRPQNNILFFNQDQAKQKILDEFPIIKTVEIRKEIPHKIVIEIEERKAVGTWCFKDTCRYFDEDGILWGQALRSSGSLLLIVDDFRTGLGQEEHLDLKFLQSIRESLGGMEDLGIKVRKIEIPENSITDFRVYASTGYYILMDSATDIRKQLAVLDIFLKEKGNNFNSEYVDLRIEGRVYYK